MNIQSNLNELYSTGFTRIYNTSESVLRNVMDQLETILDYNKYTFGLIENNSGLFVEVIRLDAE